MKHINIPIFIPHLGCPNMCVFCNQRSISGKMSFDITTVKQDIERSLSTKAPDTEAEIAFFGGSFTGIDRKLMIDLLDIAQKYVNDGKVKSIRLSTRPDYIDDEILNILSSYSVKTIELGLQSMNDEVLKATKRGHTKNQAEIACKLIKKRGFDLVGQMMIGLPSSTPESEIETARVICDLGADGARIYPTVVFYETELQKMLERGEYTPLTTDTATERTKNALRVFTERNVPCIRVGLCASESLTDPEQTAGGATHSAIGELAMSALYLDILEEQLDAHPEMWGAQKLIVECPRGEISKIIGQKRRNIEKICQKYAIKSVKVLEKNELLRYNIRIRIN